MHEVEHGVCQLQGRRTGVVIERVAEGVVRAMRYVGSHVVKDSIRLRNCQSYKDQRKR